MKRRKGRPPLEEPNYIACLNWDFGWQMPRDRKTLQKLWNQGLGFEEIAKRMKRPVGETLIFIMDQWEKGHLPARPGGIYGRRQRA